MSTKSRAKYRAAIIGLGDMGMIQHARAYRSLEQVELVAGCDLNPQRLEALGHTYGVRALYTDYHEMLEREVLDVVSVCTCPDATSTIVCDLAACGWLKAIQCEKPMAVTMGEVRRMLQACEQAGVKFGVSHQRRFLKYHQKNRELLAAGAIGDLVEVSQSVWGDSPIPGW